MSRAFAIIGAGLSGTAMLCQFLQKVQHRMKREQTAAAKINILVFEKQNSFGPGFPHGEQFVMPYHITNMCDHDMGIIAGKPDDFQQWVKANRRILQKYSDEADAGISRKTAIRDQCRHYPRAVMGEYLKARFRESLQLAKTLNISVELFPNVEVTDLTPDGLRLIIHARRILSGGTFAKTVDRALLATGHWFEKAKHDRYLTSPWPARELLRRIPAGEHVGVIGTSLSAIETVLTLTSDGKFKYDGRGNLHFQPAGDTRRIALYSRRGLIPKVRGRSGSYRNQFLTRHHLYRHRPTGGGHLTLEGIYQLLNADLESAYGRPFDWEEIINPSGSPADMLRKSLEQAENGDGPDGELIWQTVLHQSFPLARELFLRLAPAERERFEREFATLFFIHAATQPAINARKMLALLDSGIVTVSKLGANYEFIRDENGDHFVFHYRDSSGEQRRDAYRYIVNARGQEKSLKTNPSELAQNLLQSTFAQPDGPPGMRLIGRSRDISRGNTGPGNVAGRPGSIRIDPNSHRIVAAGPGAAAVPSPFIYAVGAMTRNQIIDASMAYGIARSTAVIAEDWADCLTSPAQGSVM